MDLSVAPTRCAVYYTVIAAPEEDRLLSPKQLTNAVNDEAEALFNLLRCDHTLESLRATIGLSASEKSELLAFAQVYPEEAPAIEQAIEFRRMTLAEFDRLVKENPDAVTAESTKSAAKLEPVAPEPVEVAQKVLDVLDGLDSKIVRRALYLAAGSWNVLSQSDVHAPALP
jgi:hypothetical protein